jgi:hypothetical protein
MSHRTLLRTFVSLCALIGLAGSSINLSQTNQSPRALPPFGSLSGRVVTTGNVPVAGVQVSVPRRGATTITNSNGVFVFPTLGFSPYQRLSVNFEAPGYMKTTRVYNVNRESRVAIGPDIIVIWPVAATVSMNATLGGALAFPGGAITFPPNALVNEQGVPAQGMVNVSFTRLDVTDPVQLRSVPGDFTARMQDNTMRQLESFGVFEVIARDNNGQRLDLAPGQTADFKLLIPPSRLLPAPKVIGLFSFDTDSGLWIEEGNARRTIDGLYYSGTINRFDWSWNVDDPLDTTCITVRFIDVFGSNAGPLANALVEAQGVNYSTISSGYTNSQGYVCLLVKINSLIDVTAYEPTTNFPISPDPFLSPNIVSGAADCGDPELCPLVATIESDLRLPGVGFTKLFRHRSIQSMRSAN